MAATKMAGPRAAMKVETSFRRALGKVRSARQVGGRLELLGPDDQVLLQFVAQ
jgi:heat shock protein HslJ